MVDPTLFRPLLNQSQLSHLQYEVSVEQELRFVKNKVIFVCLLTLRQGVRNPSNKLFSSPPSSLVSLLFHPWLAATSWRLSTSIYIFPLAPGKIAYDDFGIENPTFNPGAGHAHQLGAHPGRSGGRLCPTNSPSLQCSDRGLSCMGSGNPLAPLPSPIYSSCPSLPPSLPSSLSSQASSLPLTLPSPLPPFLSFLKLASYHCFLSRYSSRW